PARPLHPVRRRRLPGVVHRGSRHPPESARQRKQPLAHRPLPLTPDPYGLRGVQRPGFGGSGFGGSGSQPVESLSLAIVIATFSLTLRIDSTGSWPISTRSSPSSEAFRICGIEPATQPVLVGFTSVALSESIATWNCGFCFRYSCSTGSSSAAGVTGK